MKVKNVLLFLFLIIFCTKAYSQNFEPVQNLISREFPTMRGKVFFKKIHTLSNDTANYSSQNDQLFIAANTVPAASYALYDYVKKYCHSSISHTGDNIQIPAILPVTKHIESVSAAFPIRYALNYCTYNYTMSFWNWKDWEKELDWMSLNGVNLMLTPMGTEEVWEKTLQQLGFSDKEIRDFIPGPAFNAWWSMGNLQGWGGPVSDAMIQHWTSLQKKILVRMKELGIQPVVQAFTGLVPSTLKNHFPNADIIQQGKWCYFQRPVVLLAQDTLFNKIATLYYNNFKSLYGTDFTYFGGDLFHEGGNTNNVNLAKEGRLVQQTMQRNFPNATWLLQGWQSNPKQQILDGLDPKHTLIIDELGDVTETWLSRNQYGGFPWIWTTITDFGGKTTTGGTPLRVYTETQKVANIFGNKSLLKGTGILPEGIENNAICYQWALDRSWQKNIPDIQKNLEAFLIARYGKNNKSINEAWQYLLQTVYSGQNPEAEDGQGGFESIFCARPDTNFITTISCCGPTRLLYDSNILLQAAINFSKAADEFKSVPAFQYDLVDTWRQVINLKARETYGILMQDIHDKNKERFEKDTSRFIQLLLLQNKWLGTNSFFKVGRWLKKAIDLMPDENDKKLCEWNARVQISYWGPDDPKTFLHEYANKEWEGLLKDMYLPQWRRFFEYAGAKIEGRKMDYPNFFLMERAWCEGKDHYNELPEGDTEAMLGELKKQLIGHR